ncbi:MAG: hypothetical protein IKI79_05115 [Erysipelotrichaceae bacterium]|nr:hypothetical protein [Erysipelotrichaceae bacterium]
MTSAASVKDRLRNRAKMADKPLQELYTAYGLERVLYRLSVSEYADRFVLKGDILLYAFLMWPLSNGFINPGSVLLASAMRQKAYF